MCNNTVNDEVEKEQITLMDILEELSKTLNNAEKTEHNVFVIELKLKDSTKSYESLYNDLDSRNPPDISGISSISKISKSDILSESMYSQIVRINKILNNIDDCSTNLKELIGD